MGENKVADQYHRSQNDKVSARADLWPAPFAFAKVRRWPCIIPIPLWERISISLLAIISFFQEASFQIPLGAKVALVGGNGVGKTTLFKLILQQEAGIAVSPKAKIGYFAQNGYKLTGIKKLCRLWQKTATINSRKFVLFWPLWVFYKLTSRKS